MMNHLKTLESLEQKEKVHMEEAAMLFEQAKEHNRANNKNGTYNQIFCFL